MLATISTYFDSLKAQYPPIKSLYFGLTKELWADLRNETEYPAVLVEMPVGDGDMDDAEHDTELVFAVFDAIEKDDFPGIRSSMIQTEKIANQLVLKIYEDNEIPFGKYRIEPVMGMSHDNLHGWRVTLQVKEEVPCEYDDNWIEP